jgi:hypothetical protein
MLLDGREIAIHAVIPAQAQAHHWQCTRTLIRALASVSLSCFWDACALVTELTEVLVGKCWAQDPGDRPDFNAIAEEVRRITISTGLQSTQ